MTSFLACLGNAFIVVGLAALFLMAFSAFKQSIFDPMHADDRIQLFAMGVLFVMIAAAIIIRLSQ